MEIASFLFVCLIAGVGAQNSPNYHFNFTFSPTEFLILFEGEQKTVVITLIEKDPAITTGVLRLRSANQKVFDLRNLTEVDVGTMNAFPINYTTVVEGLSIGIEQLEIYYAESSGEEGELVEYFTVKVKVLNGTLTAIFSYLTLAWLIISYIMMGSKMQCKDLWERIKKPWVLLLAMGCQFVIMPALAFALSKAFRLDNATSLGLIMVGTCPGGWLSNIFSLLLDCDFILSLTMTFCSTILAMGMMPFNLWAYARPITIGEESLETPFLDLFLQIVYLVIPIGLSMLIARYSAKFRKYCGILLKPVATLCILIAVGFGIPAQLHVYQTATAEEFIVSALLPLFGCIAGLIIAKLVCLERRQAVTVSLETGAQNSLLAATMLAFFYPRPEADLIGKIPYIMALLSLIEGLVVTTIYILARFVFCKKRFEPKSDYSRKGSDGTMEKQITITDLREVGEEIPEKEKEYLPEDPEPLEDVSVTVPAFATIGTQADISDVDDENVYDNAAFSG